MQTPAYPHVRIFLPDHVTLSQLDRELHAVHAAYCERAALARSRAAKHRKRGDLEKWQKYCAVARCWEMAADQLWDLACPF